MDGEESKNISPIESLEMSEMELQIRRIEEEKAALELRIKNQEKYESFKKSADDIALIMKAFIDSGFSRSEAMQLMSIAMM